MKISRQTAKLSFYASVSAAIACACNITAGQSNMKHEVEDTHPSSAEIDYIALERELSKASDNLASAQGRDFMLVLGNTDSGKSTLINYLQGHKFLFELDTETEDTVLVRSEDAKVPYPSPVIGRSFESCTLLPEIFQLSENLFACDTAGFGDSRGITEEGIAYLGLQMAVRAADRIRAVVAVVEESQLTSQKGVGFRGVAQVLQTMFKGESHHPSLHLLFSKGQKTRNGLLASMKKMQTEMANLCSKEANPQKAKSNFEVASMLEILLKTENVYPFSPCDPDFREAFFKRIHQSAPIPREHISIASSTRYTQSLDRVLCEIALQGNQIIRTMQAINTAIAESISDMRHTRGMIAHHATVIDEQQENIAREKRRIKKNEAIIRYYQRQGLMHYHPILDIEYVIMKLTCDLNLMREQTLFNEKYFEIKNALLAETYNSSKEISLISFKKNKQNSLCIAEKHASSCYFGMKTFECEWRNTFMNLDCIRETVSADINKSQRELAYYEARVEDARNGSEYGYREFCNYPRQLDCAESDIQLEEYRHHKLMFEKDFEYEYARENLKALDLELSAKHLLMEAIIYTHEALRGRIYKHSSYVNINSIKDLLFSDIKKTQELLMDLKRKIETVETEIALSKEKLSYTILSKRKAEISIENSQICITNSEAIVRSSPITIAETEETIARLSDQATVLDSRFGQLIDKMQNAKLALQRLDHDNKIKMLYTICNIMQPKLEVIDEFFKLYESLPKTLDDHERLIFELNALSL